MTPHAAKKIIKQELERLKVPHTKLSAKTVSFADLARADCVFVKIHGWKPESAPHWDALDALAKKNGFRVQTDGPFG